MKEKILLVLLAVSIWSNYKTTAEVKRLSKFIDKEMVFSIDEARYDFFEGLKYYFYQGCMHGGTYEQDWKIIDEKGFVTHGVHSFCTIKEQEARERFESELEGFAKRRQ